MGSTAVTLDGGKAFVTIVSGAPRSGTSLLMQMLAAGGAPILSDGVRAADADNPRGYLEFESVKRTKQDPSWLALAVGKAVKMVYRLLKDLPAGYEYRVIFLERNLDEVLRSQAKMLARHGEPPSADEQLRLRALFEKELTECRAWLERAPGFRQLVVPFGGLIDAPLEQAQRVSSFLEWDLNLAAMAKAVDPALHRNRRPN